MKKKILVLLFFILIFTTQVFGQNALYVPFTFNNKATSMYIKPLEYNTTENSTLITGTLPQAAGTYSSVINDRVDELYNKNVEQATNTRSNSLSFSFDTYLDDDYLSIIIYSKIDSIAKKTNVDTIVFDLDNGKIIDFDEYLDTNGINSKFISDYLTNIYDATEISDNFIFSPNDTDFYIDNGKTYLIFDSYEISPSNSVETILLPLESFDKYVLDSSDYYEESNFKIKMVPLREICENFGFKVKWYPSGVIEITGNNISSRVDTINKSYTKNSARLVLESPPAISKGITYVPITYFTEALDLYYYVNPNKTITFYSYNAK